MAEIVRLHRDRAKPLVHVFTEAGYALSVPAGFRDRRLRVGADLPDEALDELRVRARTWDEERRTARRARAQANASAPAIDTTVESWSRDQKGRTYLRLADGTSVRIAAGDEVLTPAGTELSASRVATMRAGAEILRVGELIDNLVAARARTEREVRDRLGRRGIEGPALDAAIERRRGYGVLSDEEFARRFLERAARQGKSARAAAPALRRLVADPDAIATAEDELDPGEGLEAAAAKAARGLDLADPDDARRFIGRMARRGWSYGQCRPYLLAARADEDPPEG